MESVTQVNMEEADLVFLRDIHHYMMQKIPCTSSCTFLILRFLFKIFNVVSLPVINKWLQLSEWPEERKQQDCLMVSQVVAFCILL